MPASEQIKIMLIKKKTSLKELASKLNTTPSNISNKLKRDNFSETDLKEIAEALGYTYKAHFIDNETGEEI